MAALELVVTAEQAGRTVKSLLRGELGLSAGRVGRLKRTETGLTVNGRRVFVTALLRAGDRLRVDLDAAERPAPLVPAAMALEVLYEDEHLLVVNKPAGLASIPSSLSPEEPSLAQGLVHYLGPGACVHLVNRLDRGTSGVLAAAKNGWPTMPCAASSTASASAGPIWPCARACPVRRRGLWTSPSAGTRPPP